MEISAKSGTTQTGKMVVTRGIHWAMQNDTVFERKISEIITRYLNGDWGDLGDEDKQMNEDAIVSGKDRILAAYQTSKGEVFVITEWDRSATTILFTNEY